VTGVNLVGFAFTDVALDFLATLPPKARRQVVKRAKALHTQPHPPSSKRLHEITTPDGDFVFRERSGDYRVLYIVRSKPAEVVILDIAHRKEVYRMPKTKTEPADDMRMKEEDFDRMMGAALGVPAPAEDDPEVEMPPSKRLSAHPRRVKTASTKS
jgi:mRNA interferase RelE/StbE